MQCALKPIDEEHEHTVAAIASRGLGTSGFSIEVSTFAREREVKQMVDGDEFVLSGWPTMGWKRC